MASGYEVGGTDLDSVLAPLHAGWPQASATGYEVSGTDLNARYAAQSAGSAPPATGYHVSGGADLNTLFAALGTTSVVVGTQPGNVSGSTAAGNPSGTVTSNTTTCAGSKGGGTYTYTWNLASGSAAFTAPSSATTAVTATVNAGTTVSGTMYCTISDGVTSVNTNTVSWSLTNTTPATNFAITAGTSGGAVGYSNNLVDGTFGSLTSNTSGFPIVEITDFSGANSVVRMLTGSNVGQSYFTSIIINSVTRTSASATYAYDSTHGLAIWSWGTQIFGFANGNSYAGRIS